MAAPIYSFYGRYQKKKGLVLDVIFFFIYRASTAAMKAAYDQVRSRAPA